MVVEDTIGQDRYYADMGHQSLWNTLNRIEAKLDKLLEQKNPVNRPEGIKQIRDSLAE